MSPSRHREVYAATVFEGDADLSMIHDRQPFPHRQTSDGTYDSICPRCFRTVDTQRIEQNLAAEENVHVCEQTDLHSRLVTDEEHSATQAD